MPPGDTSPRLDADILAAEVADSLDEFLDYMGVDPTPLFDMVIRVLRTYADSLERPPIADGQRPGQPV